MVVNFYWVLVYCYGVGYCGVDFGVVIGVVVVVLVLGVVVFWGMVVD